MLTKVRLGIAALVLSVSAFVLAAASALGWVAIVSTHRLDDAMWWLALAVVFWVTWLTCEIWRVVLRALDWRSR